MIKANQYERALVRLKAFKLLKGWGATENEEFKPWDLGTHMKFAAKLADWALDEEKPAE